MVASQGYDETSLSEVANRIGMSKGTIMHHYGSKDRILRTMSMQYMHRRMRELDIILEDSDDPVVRLSLVIIGLVTALRDDYAATRAFSREFMRFVDDPVMEEVRKLRHEYTTRLRNIVEQCMSDGVFTCRSALVATLQIMGMCNWNWTWLDPRGPVDVDEIAAMYVDNIIGGLATKKPGELPRQLSPRIVAERKRYLGNVVRKRVALP
jgi:AcrR family transcriptional regulator